MKFGTQHYFLYIIVLKWLESKTVVIYLKLRAKLCFKGFYSFLQLSWIKWFKLGFFLHQTWLTTLFGIYFCVEIVRI